MKLSKVNNDLYYDLFYDFLLDDQLRTPLSYMVRLNHKSLEKSIPINTKYKKILELGARNGQHFKYVQHEFEEYIESDIRPQSSEKIHKARDKRIVFRIVDAQNLKEFENNGVDRIIATCVLIHLGDPIKALLEFKRVVKKDNGLISLYIPCEPGLILRISRFLTTVQKGRKHGLDHLHFHYKEHKFHYLFLKSAIEDVFKENEIIWRKYPFYFGSWNLNLWNICTIKFTDGKS
jgi:phosphatidylethanolamine/phosphatidyl-N-methylethanolamine N-methyltransferase